MPALRMKPKPNMGSLRGPNLHICHSSTLISKGSHNQVKTVPLGGVLDTFVQISHKASNHELSDECTGIIEAVCCRDPCIGATDQISNFPLVSLDSTSVQRIVPHQATCPPILETIFSPILGHDEVKEKPSSYNNEATDDEHGNLPHLVADDSEDGNFCPSEYQSCSVSDYSISELTIPAFPFDGSMEFSDLLSTTDYAHINSDLTIDMDERYMMLPFNEKTLEISSIHDDYSDKFVMNMDDPYLYFAIHQLKSSEQETQSNFHTGDMDDTEGFDPHLFIKIPDMPEIVSSICPFGSQNQTRKKLVTLVLDLDETLVHSTLDHCHDADFKFHVFFNMKEHTVYVRQRPHLHTFLERVAQMFEVVIFTASQSIYAEKLLDILDPNKKLFSHRIYRESCVFSEGSYTKDLTILGVDLAKVAIIDNSPQVFMFQVNNGIPIKSWFDDPSDNALMSLLPFLETLAVAEDVRPIIARKFNKEQ